MSVSRYNITGEKRERERSNARSGKNASFNVSQMKTMALNKEQ